MNEIEKLMQNAGFKKDLPINLADLDFSEEDCDELCLDNSCDECRYKTYPPFTAEKQIQLENFLLEDLEDKKTFTQFEMLKTIENKFLYVYRFSKNNSNLKRVDMIGETRQECVAGLINFLWQSLTSEEQQQIKEILE